MLTWSPCVNVIGTNPVSPSSIPVGFKFISPTLDNAIKPLIWETLYTYWETSFSSLGNITVAPTLRGASSINVPETSPTTSAFVNCLLTRDISPMNLVPKLYSSMSLSNSIIGLVAWYFLSGTVAPASRKFCLWCQKLILLQMFLFAEPRCNTL